MRVDRFRLLFFGSDPFSIRVLDYLLSKQICHTEVVAKPHTLLDKFSISKRLKRHAWPLELRAESSEKFNIGLVASFGSLINQATVSRFELGLFNVHPSLLPKYRGSTPVQAAVFDGIKETGCTIMRIPPVEKFDIGDIVLQERLRIKDREYAIDLRDRLADLGAQMAERLLTNYDDCIKLSQPQDSSKKSLARKLKLEQGLLQFRADTLDLIDRKVRAYTGFIELYTFCLNGLRVELAGMEDPKVVERYELDSLVLDLIAAQSDKSRSVITEGHHVAAGTMFFHKIRRQLCVKTGDCKWLAFEWATPKLKPKMIASEFYNGYLSKVPQQLRMTDL